MQRLRMKFSREKEIMFISHLDIMRLWERALRRARIPLAYSEGFSPHPRLSLAAPLAVGITSEAELMDVFISKWVSPHWFSAVVNGQLPPGIEILDVYLIAVSMPSLQSQVRFAEYQVEVENEKQPEDVRLAIAHLLSLEHLPWQHQRDTGQRNYDLRVLIDDLWLVDRQHQHHTVGMRLRCSSSGSGRPEQVITALGFTHHPRAIHRTRLILGT